MSADRDPEQIKLTPAEAEALKARIAASPLSKQDIKIVLGLISFNLWLRERLARAKISIKRLRRAFGFSTEKKKH